MQRPHPTTSSTKQPLSLFKQKSSKKKNGNKKEILASYALIFPNMVVFSIWVLFPVIFTMILSFTDWNFLRPLNEIQFVGFENYVRLPDDVWFTDSLINTLQYTLVVVSGQILFGLFFALILDRQVYLPTIPRILIFIPYITSPVASALIWLSLFNPNWGPVNTFLYDVFGIMDPPKWFASTDWALPALMIVGIWKGIGYNAIIFLAGLQSVPDELQEAAAIDGANWFNRVRSITIPLLKPTTFFLVITGIINAFRVFDLVAVLTQGGPGTATVMIAYHIYRVGFSFYQMGYASAAGMIMLIIVFIFTLIQWRIQAKQLNYL
jgi:multiple sugar transport system permease protein